MQHHTHRSMKKIIDTSLVVFITCLTLLAVGSILLAAYNAITLGI